MTYNTDSTLTTELLEQISQEGLEQAKEQNLNLCCIHLIFGTFFS